MFIHQTQLNKDCFLHLSFDKINSNHFELRHLKYGYLHYVFDPEDGELRILYVFICNSLRKCGFARKLMKNLFDYIEKEMKYRGLDCIHVYLDDVSEKYGKLDNLYLQFGFDYIEKDKNGNPTAPEMEKVIKIC
jgi:hypothetical protein